jgi:hypothetical protein
VVAEKAMVVEAVAAVARKVRPMVEAREAVAKVAEEAMAARSFPLVW